MNSLLHFNVNDDTARLLAQAAAVRSLDLLRAVEFTLVSVENDTKLLGVMRDGIDDLQRALIKAEVQTPLDRGGDVCVNLERATDVLSRMYAAAQARRQIACEDSRLAGDDGVAEAWSGYLIAVRDLHDGIEALREWVEIHDAVLEPGSGAHYDDVEDLIAALRSA